MLLRGGDQPATAANQAAARSADGQEGTVSDVMATAAGMTLRVPATDPTLIGYHEASLAEAIEFKPVGMLLTDDNTTKSIAHVPSEAPEFVILSSRGREQAASSAVDVVIPKGMPVLSPIDGVVTNVRQYWLYGKYQDVRIEIAPAGFGHLRIVMIHVDGPLVSKGDNVVAGETRLGEQARAFDFNSHIDNYVGRRVRHVHIEAKPVGAPSL